MSDYTTAELRQWAEGHCDCACPLHPDRSCACECAMHTPLGRTLAHAMLALMDNLYGVDATLDIQSEHTDQAYRLRAIRAYMGKLSAANAKIAELEEVERSSGELRRMLDRKLADAEALLAEAAHVLEGVIPRLKWDVSVELDTLRKLRAALIAPVPTSDQTMRA